MTGPCAQLKTLALTLWSVEKLIKQQNRGSRVQEAKKPVRTLLENPGTRRLGYTGGSQFWGDGGGKNTDKAPDCWLHIKESNGLGNIPSNLLAFISQAHKNARINYETWAS